MPKTLQTRTSPYTAVFRAIVQQLKIDPVISRLVPGDALRSWEGTQRDRLAFEATHGKPVMRLTALPQHEDWYAPAAQYGDLLVMVELAVTTTCSDDITDLWHELVIALAPASTDWTQSLVKLGAETGEITFSMPTKTENPNAANDGGQWHAVGFFTLKVIDQFATDPTQNETIPNPSL